MSERFLDFPRDKRDYDDAFLKCSVNLCTTMNSLVRGRNLRRYFIEFMVVMLLDDAF